MNDTNHPQTGTPPSAELHRWTVRQMAEGLRARTITSTQLLEHYLARIARINPVLNAIITVDEDGARQAAKASDERFSTGRAASLLDGIPLAIKDNILVKGMRAVWGSRWLESHVPDHDELPVALLRAGGAVLIGKTNVPEFTLRGFTSNPVFGATGNAWDPERTPGGSSGGSVSAVAAGLVPLSLGTDGGGSIRRPAGYCGIVGLKPTLSRIPRADGLPNVLYDCEIVGPLARTVDDARIMMSVLGQPHVRDSRSRGFAPMTDAMAMPYDVRDGGKKLRILFVERFGDAPVDSEIVACCHEAADALRVLGHEVETGALPFAIDRINAEWAKLGNMGLSMLARRDPAFDGLVSPDFADQARAGATLQGADYLELIEMLWAFRSTVGEAYTNFDVIMTPTAAAHPWPKAQAYPPMIDGKEAGPRGHAVFTNWVNACGHPGISLPAGWSEDGMPIGLQLVGDFGTDTMLLDLASAYEKVRPWAQRWPDLANH